MYEFPRVTAFLFLLALLVEYDLLGDCHDTQQRRHTQHWQNNDNFMKHGEMIHLQLAD